LRCVEEVIGNSTAFEYLENVTFKRESLNLSLTWTLVQHPACSVDGLIDIFILTFNSNIEKLDISAWLNYGEIQEPTRAIGLKRYQILQGSLRQLP
jgi:hypothetical protein